MNANELLNKAEALMTERGKQYDQPEGERSMARAVSAFNAITGKALPESDGWLLLALLKMVRDNQRVEPHADSIEDLVAYAALYGESRLSQPKGKHVILPTDDGPLWIKHEDATIPVPRKTKVQVKYLNGDTAIDLAWAFAWWKSQPPEDLDIFAYRVIND
jgi:hypothetical protein